MAEGHHAMAEMQGEEGVQLMASQSGDLLEEEGNFSNAGDDIPLEVSNGALSWDFFMSLDSNENAPDLCQLMEAGASSSSSQTPLQTESVNGEAIEMPTKHTLRSKRTKKEGEKKLASSSCKIRTILPKITHDLLNFNGCPSVTLVTNESTPSVRSNRPRMKWTKELRESFKKAVDALGGLNKATPKRILRIMGARNVSLWQVKSFLQKYRITKQRNDSKEDESDRSSHELVNSSEDNDAGNKSSKECETNEESGSPTMEAVDKPPASQSTDSGLNDKEKKKKKKKNEGKCDKVEKPERNMESFLLEEALSLQKKVMQEIELLISEQRNMQKQIENQHKNLAKILKEKAKDLNEHSKCSAPLHSMPIIIQSDPPLKSVPFASNESSSRSAMSTLLPSHPATSALPVYPSDPQVAFHSTSIPSSDQTFTPQFPSHYPFVPSFSATSKFKTSNPNSNFFSASPFEHNVQPESPCDHTYVPVSATEPDHLSSHILALGSNFETYPVATSLSAPCSERSLLPRSFSANAATTPVVANSVFLPNEHEQNSLFLPRSASVPSRKLKHNSRLSSASTPTRTKELFEYEIPSTSGHLFPLHISVAPPNSKNYKRKSARASRSGSNNSVYLDEISENAQNIKILKQYCGLIPSEEMKKLEEMQNELKLINNQNMTMLEKQCQLINHQSGLNQGRKRKRYQTGKAQRFVSVKNANSSPETVVQKKIQHHCVDKDPYGGEPLERFENQLRTSQHFTNHHDQFHVSFENGYNETRDIRDRENEDEDYNSDEQPFGGDQLFHQSIPNSLPSSLPSSPPSTSLEDAPGNDGDEYPCEPFMNDFCWTESNRDMISKTLSTEMSPVIDADFSPEDLQPEKHLSDFACSIDPSVQWMAL